MSLDQGTPPPEETTPPTPTEPPPEPSSADLSTYSREQLENELVRTRREAGRYRVRGRDTVKALAAAAGVEYTPDLDVDQVVKRLADAPAQLRNEVNSLKVKGALDEAFLRHGVSKPTLVRAYLTEAGHRFDPSIPDFGEHVDNVVAEVLELNPELRGQGNSAMRTSSHFAGGVPASTQLTRAELQGMDASAVNRAREAGQLDDLLGRRH